MFENVLIANDDSQLVKNAMRYTANAFPDSRYHILNVIDTSDESIPYTDIIMDDLRKASKRAIKDGIDILKEMGVEIARKAVREGTPGEEIIDYSNENDIDLIVIGTQSKQGIQKFEIGDTCMYTLEHSSIPVLVFDAIVDIKRPEKILHPTSETHRSLGAGYLAIKLVKHFDGSLKVLSLRGGHETQSAHKKLLEFADKNHIKYKIRSCAVKPHEEIIREAKKSDLIVGSLARPGLKYELRKIYPPFAVGELEREILIEARKPILFETG